MDNINRQIAGMKKELGRFLTCDYLYSGFDTLVASLELPENQPLSAIENEELKTLIEYLAADSYYNTHSSANWVRYSARCFYCADCLVQYVNDEGQRNSLRYFLNGYFHRLIQAGVAVVIPDETLDKYILWNIHIAHSFSFFADLIEKSISLCNRGRTWSVDEMSLACKYTMSVKRLILKYIKDYSDYLHLKDWLPKLGTVGLANTWYNFPESGNYEHMRESARDRVEDYLDKMLEAHLELFSLWFSHNPQELIDTLSEHDLIEIMEVTEDDEFEKILRHAVTLPWNEKVEGVLKHFLDDDEQWIVNLSRELLTNYKR